jgi:hypothetical protein
LKTLIVEIRHHPDGTIIGQPPPRDRSDYSVRGHLIEIHRSPVHLQFNANVPLTAVGFAEAGQRVGKYTESGACGGCFSLVTAFKLGTGMLATPLILNQGEPVGARYHFKLWAFGENGIDVELTSGIDPQIYNQGDGPGDGD